MPRQLVAPDKALIVLDTSPLRDIAHDKREPQWVGAFARMREAGHVFCLADATFAELISQRARVVIDDEGHAVMLDCIAKFVDPEFPILPGKRDILGMLGIDEAWSEAEAGEMAREAFQMLASAKPGSAGAEKELDEERESYRGWFASFEEHWIRLGSTELHERQHPALDAALLAQRTGWLVPDMDARNDLMTRLLWRQFVRYKKEHEPYDPAAENRRNDGIDLDVYRYLALPALVVAADKGFFSRISDIPSFQKAWFKKPQELAREFESGSFKPPTWPRPKKR